MARPFPLSAPDGRVYAYACGRCHQVGSSGSRFVELTGPDESLVRMSLSAAERCCSCTRCGAEMGRAFMTARVCDACRPAYDAELEASQARNARRREAVDVQVALSLGKAKDLEAATDLRDAMRELSEERWSAGWLSGLEFLLWEALTWEALTGGPLEDGEWDTREAQRSLAKLRELHERAGGWWHWPPHGVKLTGVLTGPEDEGPTERAPLGFEGACEVFVSTDEWLQINAERVARNAAREAAHVLETQGGTGDV